MDNSFSITFTAAQDEFDNACKLADNYGYDSRRATFALNSAQVMALLLIAERLDVIAEHIKDRNDFEAFLRS